MNTAPSTPSPILYSFRRCPYAMRGRMGLYYAGIELELREIVLRDKPAHMLEISPKGTVPVLLLPDGTVIDESLDIMHWSLSQNDPDHWLTNENKEEIAKLIQHNDHVFKHALDRYKYPNRYPDEDCSNMRDKGEETLKSLNKRLENTPYLCGDAPSLADIAIFPFIRQFANVDRNWFDARPYTALQQWLQHRLNSELFQAIMKKYPPWKDGDKPLHWPET